MWPVDEILFLEKLDYEVIAGLLNRLKESNTKHQERI